MVEQNTVNIKVECSIHSGGSIKILNRIKQIIIQMNNLFYITNPLDQFEIRDLISINAPILGDLYLSLTNILLYLIISFSIIVILSSITNKSRKLIYNN
jgi:hypothetical protein